MQGKKQTFLANENSNTIHIVHQHLLSTYSVHYSRPESFRSQNLQNSNRSPLATQNQIHYYSELSNKSTVGYKSTATPKFLFQAIVPPNKSTVIQNVVTGTIVVLYNSSILILWHFRTNAINPHSCTLSLYVLMRPLYTISKANSAHFY